MRSLLVGLAAIATLAASGAGNATAAGPLNRGGVVVQVPVGWLLTPGRINNVVDPVTVFTISTYPVQKINDSSSGYCSVALQQGWRADGAYVQLTEERDGASRARMLTRIQHRPAHFRLHAKGAGGLCTPADSGALSFQERGRAFSVYYGFGPKAPKATRARVAAMLDSMKIAPRT